MFYKEALLSQVGWCVVVKNPINGDFRSLFQELSNLQCYSERKYASYDFPRANIMPTIERKYWLTENDRENAEFLLTQFRSHLATMYFVGGLTANRWTSRLRGGEYFLYKLYHFLASDQDNKGIYCGYGRDIVTYIRSDNNYEYYKLTDFGVVYYKLLVITASYCVTLFNSGNKDDNESLGVLSSALERFKDLLDTRAITTIKYKYGYR